MRSFTGEKIVWPPGGIQDPQDGSLVEIALPDQYRAYVWSSQDQKWHCISHGKMMVEVPRS